MERPRYLYLFLILLSCSSLAYATGEKTRTTFNPFTGKLDYITDVSNINGVCYQWPASLPSSDSLCLSETVVNSCVVLAWATCSGASVGNFLLLESAAFFLLEDGTKILLEQ